MNWLLKISLCAAATLVFLPTFDNSADAQTRRSCPALQSKIEFTVQTIPKNIDYNLNLTQQQLSRLANNFNRSRVNSNANTIGLTHTSQEVSYSMRSEIVQISPNRYCGRILSVDVTITVTKLKVYVLRKYRRGSCQYAAIIDHEHEHVATYQNGIETLERAFLNRLWRTIKNLRPGIASSPQRAQQIAFRNMDTALARILTPIERQMRVRDRQIDTPLSYQLIRQQCRTW
mgnify:CR=1 FL=1|tara:strand:- start:1525 stop:2217 length:693 start_codon:yes stop_codon:yes gene_type:complete